jgi:hypothetical protein
MTYARLQTTATRPEGDDLVPKLTAMISGHPGFAGLLLLEGEERAGALLTLWETASDAEKASERSRAAGGPPPVTITSDEIYEVDDDEAAVAAGRPVGAALLGFFDGPLTAERETVARRRGRESIGPVVRQVPGMIRTLVLWHPARRGFVVVHLAESAAVLAAVGDAVRSVPLRDGEDPALLTGPDRLSVHRVVAYEPAAG